MIIKNTIRRLLNTGIIQLNKRSLNDLAAVVKPHERAKIKEPGEIYYPKYLDKGEPYPNYGTVNINIHGYDYIKLDIFNQYVSKLCKSLDINVVEMYRVPMRTYKIKTLKNFSSTIDTEFSLNYYHRVVKVSNLKSHITSILFDAIQLNLPEGVQLNVQYPLEINEEYRYIPDVSLKALKDELAQFEK
jgi:ribosomal protein S10